MSLKTIFRFLGIFMILNGVFSLVFGKAFVRPWRVLGGPVAAYVSFLLRWPDWLVRLAGVGEAVAGARVLGSTRVQVSELYSVGASVYDPLLALWNAALADVEVAVDRAVGEYLPPGGRVLDLGCGTGANVARLQRVGTPFSQYVGVDVTPQMLAVARSKFAHLPNVTFVQRDLLRDPWPEGEFDLIVSTWVFSHLKERAGEVVERARQHLNPDGHIVVLMVGKTDSWLDPLFDAVFKTFLAEPVPKGIYLAFPVRVSVERFMGGMATLVVLQKE